MIHTLVQSFFEDNGAPTNFLTIMELLQSCTQIVKRYSLKDIDRRFYLNMEITTRLLLNLTVLGRIKWKLGPLSTRNKSLKL